MFKIKRHDEHYLNLMYSRLEYIKTINFYSLTKAEFERYIWECEIKTLYKTGGDYVYNIVTILVTIMILFSSIAFSLSESSSYNVGVVRYKQERQNSISEIKNDLQDVNLRMFDKKSKQSQEIVFKIHNMLKELSENTLNIIDDNTNHDKFLERFDELIQLYQDKIGYDEELDRINKLRTKYLAIKLIDKDAITSQYKYGGINEFLDRIVKYFLKFLVFIAFLFCFHERIQNRQELEKYFYKKQLEIAKSIFNSKMEPKDLGDEWKSFHVKLRNINAMC